LTRFLRLSPTQLVFFLGEDFENVVELNIGNLVESWAENLIENLVGNWVRLMVMRRKLIVKIWSILLMTVLIL